MKMKFEMPATAVGSQQFLFKALIYFLMAFLIICVAYVAGVAAKEGLDAFFPSSERERQTLEREKLRLESIHLPSVARARAEAQVDLERSKVEAERIRLGLAPLTTQRMIGNAQAQVLDDLGQVFAKYLIPIGAVWLMFLVSQGFAAHHRPWILALHTSLLVVLLGGSALLYGATTDTSLQIKWKELFVTFNTGSVGLVLIGFGTALAAFSLWTVSRESSK